MIKHCIVCNQLFEKLPNQSKTYWSTRKFCGRKCSNEDKKGKFYGSSEELSRKLKEAYANGTRVSYFKGRKPWNKGTKGLMPKPWNKGIKTGIIPESAFKKGCISVNPFPKGNIPWNKGIIREDIRGDKHWNWKGGKPRKDRRLLLSYEEHRQYMDWRKAVFIRDSWNCQECGKHGGILHADHIKPWVDYEDLRFNLDNGRTLCPLCHYKTPSYGRHKSNNINCNRV